MKFSFVTPHQNERPCVNQVQKKLFPLLGAKVTVIKIKADNIMDRCLSARKGMPASKKMTRKFEDCFHALAKAHDFASRVSYAYAGLIENKADFHVEMHAFDASQFKNFNWGDWGRVPNTKIQLYKGEPILFGISEILLPYKGLINEIAHFFGIDARKTVSDAVAKLDALLPLKSRIIELEVPGKSVHISSTHPVYGYFGTLKADIWAEGSSNRPKNQEFLTHYETIYCTAFCNSIGLHSNQATHLADFLIKKAFE